MATQIVIPSLGESISEGVISKWLKSDGDAVERDEPVLELETDKITMEVPSPAAGALSIGAKAGETVTVGAVVGAIDESAAGAPAKPAKKSAAAEGKSPAPKSGAPVSPAAPVAQAAPPARPAAADAPPAKAGSIDNGAHGASDGDGDVRLTPLARKIADEKGVDVSRIAGTGPGGRIREQDVLAYLQSHTGGAMQAAPGARPQPQAQHGPSGRQITRERMTPLRQRVAARLVEAQRTAAMLTTFNECDMTAVMESRKRLKDAFEKRHGVGLGFMSFFVKACVNALEAFPRVNSQIAEGPEGPEMVQHHYADIAVAVGTPRGLVVPVVRNCESLSFAQIEQTIKELAERAKNGKLTLEEMQGGTFTISNGGVYGSMLSTPILNPPQSGILGMHNIIRRPVENPEKPGSGEVAVRPMMYLALSYDHRVIDGAEAVGFLRRVKECIEAPERMLLGV